MSDLQHYLDTGEVPSDPDTLARLYQQAIGAEAEKPEDEQVESEAKADAKVEETAATGQTEAKGVEDKAEEKEPEGILSKNGKHIISYDRLVEERQARQQYQNQVQELQRQIEALKEGAGNAETLTQFTGMTEEQLADLKTYFPEQYENIVGQQKALHEATQKLAQAEHRELQRQKEQQRQTELSVQEEIDNNPTLSHWQRNNPDIFAKCAALDDELLKDPNTANLSMQERFEKVAAAISQIYGSPIKAEPKQEAAKPEEKPVKKATAQAKPPINSLSDVAGGTAPEISEMQRLEDSSSAEIGERLMKMTDDQRAAFLNSLG